MSLEHPTILLPLPPTGSCEPDCSDRHQRCPSSSSRSHPIQLLLLSHYATCTGDQSGRVVPKPATPTRCLLRTPSTERFFSRSHSSGWANLLIHHMPDPWLSVSPLIRYHTDTVRAPQEITPVCSETGREGLYGCAGEQGGACVSCVLDSTTWAEAVCVQSSGPRRGTQYGLRSVVWIGRH
jgi:hypothetical protein